MRNLCIVALWGLVSFIPQVSAQDAQKTWIFLTDKRDAMGKTTTVEPGYISQRALERRQLRGSGWSVMRDAPVSPAYVEALASEGVTVVRRSRWLNAVTAYLDADQRAAVSQLPFVQKLQRVAGLSTGTFISAPSPSVLARPRSRLLDCGGSCGQLELVNAIVPLDNGINGAGVIVGFVDTRFDHTTGDSSYVGEQLGHPATVHFANESRFKYRNFTADDPGIEGLLSPNFHGVSTTSVALGYAEGTLIGPCHGADSVYIAQTEWTGMERNVEEDNFVEAVEWMEASGVDVINSSLGYSMFDEGENSYTPSDMDGDTGITTIAFDLAAQNGVVPVNSAGNSGDDPWYTVVTPADGDSVIAVGAVNPNKSTATFSSRGPTADGRIKPDVSAQGVGAYVAFGGGGYGHVNGTSFSAPMVTGIVCQLLQVNPNMTPKQVADALRQTADRANNPDNEQGWGIVDAQAAIDKAQEILSGVAQSPTLPSLISVQSPYPNPFGEEARFTVTLSEPLSDVRVEVFNAIGQRVLTPHAGPLSAGEHTFAISGRGLSAGLYTFVVTGGSTTQSGLMMHIR